MPRRTRQKQKQQRGGSSYHMPSEYFGHQSGAFLDATDPAMAPRAADPVMARAEIPVRGNAFTDLTGIQTGGARTRQTPRSRRSRKTRSTFRRRSRSTRRRRQIGGAVRMPSKYYGGDSNGFIDQSGPLSYQTGYGDSVPTSFGQSTSQLGAAFAGPNHGPGGAFAEVQHSGIQTGGSGRRRRHSGKTHRRRRR